MKVLALSTLLVFGLYAPVPAFASTPVYNSKASSPAISSCGCGSTCVYRSASDADLHSAAFDGSSTSSKLGSSHSETGLVDVMTPALRTECSKCSS
jgi:hypothetical protein